MFRDRTTDIVRKKKEPNGHIKRSKNTRSHLSLARFNRAKYAENYISLRGKRLPLGGKPLIVPNER